jgi:hypothetical protein
MPEINQNIIKVRVGADNANRVISAAPSTKLSNLDDINTANGLPNNSVLVYNSSTNQWSPYPYIDGGTY